jgi:tryptophan-rich sensory protein
MKGIKLVIISIALAILTALLGLVSDVYHWNELSRALFIPFALFLGIAVVTSAFNLIDSLKEEDENKPN